MRIKQFGIGLVGVFTIPLVTAAFVTLLWNMIWHGVSAIY